MLDTAIIGAGPAGISAALNLKLHNKNIAVFDSSGGSYKLSKAEKIANYPGLPMISGQELSAALLSQAGELGITVTQKKVTDITPMGKSFMLLADNEVFEAKTVILAPGAVLSKGIPGENELLGRGVSYCATCDGFLYSGKTIAVYCGSRSHEHEVSLLSGFAAKLYLYAPYSDCGAEEENIERLSSAISGISGAERAQSITLADGSTLPVDGVFVLRDTVMPSVLLRGIKTDGPHIAVDREMKTSISGVFAAGDCTGRPYQIAKAVGEGNIAAHSALELL